MTDLADWFGLPRDIQKDLDDFDIYGVDLATAICLQL
jgi:hypothetical protein